MADDPTLVAALRSADAAGDTRRAQQIASQILQARQSQPGDKGGLVAALHGALDTASFGLFDKAAPYIGAGLTGESVAQARNEISGNEAATDNAHPLANFAGNVGGVALGGGAISAGLGAAKALPLIGRVAEGADNLLAAQKGQPIRNVARAAATGAGFGAADAYGHGGSEDDALLSAGVGAIAGPLAGKVVTSVVKAASPAAQKAMALLADKIGEKPDVLQRAFDNFKASTGRVPTMAELVGMKTQGELRQVATDNPLIGAQLSQAQDAADAARAQSLPLRIAQVGGNPTDVKTLVEGRKATMTAAMNPIRDTPVPVSNEDLNLLMDRRVQSAIRQDPVLQKKFGNVAQALAFNPDGVAHDLTVDDFDSIRKSLRGEQAKRANPANSLHNPHIAESYGNLADAVSNIAIEAAPQYGDALEQFGRDSRFISGFKHGMAGRGVGEADKPELINALNTVEGQQGHAVGTVSRLVDKASDSESGARSVAGQLGENTGTRAALNNATGFVRASDLGRAGTAETAGARALGNIAPGTVRPESTDSDVMHLAHAAAAATYHSPTAIGYHVSRIFGGKLKMSPLVQQKVAQYLADPKMTQQGINLLKRAGASNDDLRRLATAVAGSAGAAVGNAEAGHQ